MPTYEYRCKTCDYYFEKHQSMKDEPIHTCPKCGGTVVKLFSSNVGLIFKGSGFYITDYKNKNSSSPSNGNGKHNSTNSSTKTESGSASEKVKKSTESKEK